MFDRTAKRSPLNRILRMKLPNQCHGVHEPGPYGSSNRDGDAVNHPGPYVGRRTLRSKQILIWLVAIFSAILLISIVEKGPTTTGTIAATTALLGCPVGPSAQQEFNPNRAPMEIEAVWSRSADTAVTNFINKYKGCLTTSIAVSGPTRAAGAPPNSSFELAAFFADASTQQIVGVTHAFEDSGLFTKVTYMRALNCPGVTFQSLGYCVQNLDGQWDFNPSTG
jgi:hypothetical protein